MIAGDADRLDEAQAKLAALGLEAEPVTPSSAPLHFAARISFPDPIGLLADVAAGVESRWQMAPLPAPSRLLEQGSRWHLARLRARMDPVAAWEVSQTGAGRFDLSPCPAPDGTG